MLLLAIGLLLVAGWGAGEMSGALLQRVDPRWVQDVAAERAPVLTWIAHALSLTSAGRGRPSSSCPVGAGLAQSLQRATTG